MWSSVARILCLADTAEETLMPMPSIGRFLDACGESTACSLALGAKIELDDDGLESSAPTMKMLFGD
jgi:hypothetical protein